MYSEDLKYSHSHRSLDVKIYRVWEQLCHFWDIEVLFYWYVLKYTKILKPANPAATRDRKKDNRKQEGIPKWLQQSKLQNHSAITSHVKIHLVMCSFTYVHCLDKIHDIVNHEGDINSLFHVKPKEKGHIFQKLRHVQEYYKRRWKRNIQKRDALTESGVLNGSWLPLLTVHGSRGVATDKFTRFDPEMFEYLVNITFSRGKLRTLPTISCHCTYIDGVLVKNTSWSLS